MKTAKHSGSAVALTIALDDGEPPAEFKIFDPKVSTSKGDFIFDAKAAKAVMAAWAAQGNELMIDYDHASLSSTVAADPAQAGKAAGWFTPELREDGTLWATRVRWTQPAAEALKRREWRYMSPAFETENKRVASLINVALTNLPATKRLDPLMAANQQEARMDLSALAKALGLEDGATVAQIVEAFNKAVNPAPAAPEKKDEAAPAAAAASATATPAAAPAVPAPVAAKMDPELVELLNQQKTEIEALRDESRRAKILEVLRASDRDIKPGFQTWALSKPIEDVEAMLPNLPAKPKAARAPNMPGDPGSKAIQVGAQVVHLSQRQLAICEEEGCKPEVFAAMQSRRNVSAES